MDRPAITPLLIIKFALTILWLIGFEWVFALQARFENTVAGTLKNAFIFGISRIAMTVALVIVDAVFVALLAASWFDMPGGLFLLVILGYGTMLMLHIPVAERVFKPYLIDLGGFSRICGNLRGLSALCPRKRGKDNKLITVWGGWRSGVPIEGY